MEKAQNRHSQTIGYYDPQTALWGHIIYFHKKVKDSAELIEKYGKFGMRGFSRSLPDDHTLLKIKDKSQPFTKKQAADLPQLRNSRISELLTKALTNLYAKYLKRSDVAFIDLVKMVDRTNISGEEPIIARLYLHTYEIMNSKYLQETYWYLRKPLWAYYGGGGNSTKVVYSIDTEDNQDTHTHQLPKQQLQPQTPPQHLFASLMAQMESLTPDFHTFLLACGFVFHKHEIINGKQMLTARLSNIIFVEVIENHALFAEFEKLLRNVFGANCNLQYTVNAPQVQAQPKTPPQPEQIKQPTPLFASSDKRTGTTNSIGNLTAIPQTPKVQQQAPPTDQEKLSTAISKVAKFSENYAVQLHKFLEFNRIDQNILYLKCWSAQAIDKIQLHTLYENLCTALQATFEVEGVILETYKL